MATRTILEAPKLSSKNAVNNLASLLDRKKPARPIKGAKAITKNKDTKANLKIR